MIHLMIMSMVALGRQLPRGGLGQLLPSAAMYGELLRPHFAHSRPQLCILSAAVERCASWSLLCTSGDGPHLPLCIASSSSL